MNYVVLVYHAIGEETGYFYVLKEEVLSKHLAYLHDRGIQVTSGGGEGPSTEGNRVVLTFDGCRSADWAYTQVLPLLQSHGYPAFFFLTTSLIGGPRYLTASQVRELASLGMTIGSHSHTHPTLTRVSPPELRQELKKSKEVLEDILGEPISSISIPDGPYNQAVLDAAREAGYRQVFTSAWGFNRTDGALSSKDFLVLRRFCISRATSFNEFQRIVNGQGTWLITSKYRLKEGVKRLLGERAYRWLRAQWPGWRQVRG